MSKRVGIITKNVLVKRHSMHFLCWRAKISYFKHVSNRHPWVPTCLFKIPPCHGQTIFFCVRSCQLARCTTNNNKQAANSRLPKTLHLPARQNPLAHTAHSILYQIRIQLFKQVSVSYRGPLPPGDATHNRYLQVLLNQILPRITPRTPRKRGCCTHIYYTKIQESQPKPAQLSTYNS